MRVAKVAQKEPMETVHCTLLETGETQAAQQSLVQRARSVLFGTCVVQNCKKIFLNNPWVVRPAVAHKRSAQHTFWP